MKKSAQRRKKNKKRVKRDIDFKKPLLYGSIVFFSMLLVYRILVLLTFQVESSSLSDDVLSTGTGMVRNLYIFERDGRIENVEVIIYSRGQQNILRINLLTSVHVQQEGLNSFPIASLKNVGEFLQHESAKQYTIEYIGSLLGIKFNNYIWLVDSSYNTEDLFSDLSIFNIMVNPVYSHKLRGNVYSNLPILNLIKETNLNKQMLSNYRYEQIDIANCCIEEDLLEGGIREVRFSIRKFDLEFPRYVRNLVSREVERERVNVEVYNATDVTGMASKYARRIRHTGCRILRFDNAPNFFEKTVVYIPNPEDYVNSIPLILDVLGENVEIRYERPVFMTTGDIVVILGQDILE